MRVEHADVNVSTHLNVSACGCWDSISGWNASGTDRTRTAAPRCACGCVSPGTVCRWTRPDKRYTGTAYPGLPSPHTIGIRARITAPAHTSLRYFAFGACTYLSASSRAPLGWISAWSAWCRSRTGRAAPLYACACACER